MAIEIMNGIGLSVHDIFVITKNKIFIRKPGSTLSAVSLIESPFARVELHEV